MLANNPSCFAPPCVMFDVVCYIMLCTALADVDSLTPGWAPRTAWDLLLKVTFMSLMR